MNQAGAPSDDDHEAGDDHEGKDPLDGGRWAERRVTISFLVSAGFSVALAAVYWNGGQTQLEGVFLSGALAGLAIGGVTWANRLMPQGPFTDNRHDLTSSESTILAMEDDVERGGFLTRRKMVVRSLGAAALAFGAAMLFPLRSLGPRPGAGMLNTPWRAGRRLVTSDGRAVQAADVPVGGLVTVFPEGHTDSASGQAVLIRVPSGLLNPTPERESWSPEGLIAYSKVCTHAGCPVGLYQSQSHELMCPCHQSTFDVLQQAEPIFGPAAAPLPQLPIEVNELGQLVAQGDFSAPVGPTFWHRQ
ncbi:MAG TPA: Rieske 2Fe-2S domain-containing protein [Microthrixaceae bacterium]|nr:Rieske 2Fe-2S domain-containing protein [Microthrixaceae bacterium]